MLTYSAIFERALRLNPEGIAVDANDARLTYRELDARAEALANLLVERGIGGAECVVGICVPRSAAMIVALVAIVLTFLSTSLIPGRDCVTCWRIPVHRQSSSPTRRREVFLQDRIWWT